MMKMKDVFEVDSFNIHHHCSIVDTSRYAYIEHNEVEVENEEYINFAVQNHDQLVEERDRLRELLTEYVTVADTGSFGRMGQCYKKAKQLLNGETK